MDKFDDYLEKQSKCEKEKFVLPQSFDRKVEDILLNLDSELKKENNKWYKNKKLWTTAACFAFICLAGMGLSKQIHLGKNEKKQCNARQLRPPPPSPARPGAINGTPRPGVV